MSMKCFVPNCFIYKDTKYYGITFHKFPINPVARENWIKALPFKIGKLSNSAVICSLHFHPSDIRRNPTKTFIVKGAVPSIFRDWLEVKKNLVRQHNEPGELVSERKDNLISENKEKKENRENQDNVADWVRTHAKIVDEPEKTDKEDDAEESPCEEYEEDFIVVEIRSNCSNSSAEGRSEDPLEDDEDNEPGTDYPPDETQTDNKNKPETDYTLKETEQKVLGEDTNVENTIGGSDRYFRRRLRWAMEGSDDEKRLPADSDVRTKLELLRHYMKAKERKINCLKAKLYRSEAKYQKLVKTLRVVPSKFVKIHDVDEI